MATPVHPPKRPSEGLTSIHTRIHCATTHYTPEEVGELDRIVIDNFIKILAEVVISVTRREQQVDDESDSIHSS
jgi:hypothetical protein